MTSEQIDIAWMLYRFQRRWRWGYGWFDDALWAQCVLQSKKEGS